MEKTKVFFKKNPENTIHKLVSEGFDIDSGEKRCILKCLVDGKRWDMPACRLEEERLIDGKITTVWERMPEGWYPSPEDRHYPGYTDDPRKVVLNDDFYITEQRSNYRMPQTNHFDRRRAGFR